MDSSIEKVLQEILTGVTATFFGLGLIGEEYFTASNGRKR